MPEPPKATNFEYLDPDAPRTKRIIDAALTVYVPWETEQALCFSIQRPQTIGNTSPVA